jgi:GWxTD domain-containing protein
MYQKWLAEDVVWIITPKERAQFMKLSSNDERDEFIKQFWQDHDVQTLGGGENNFRMQHYRRIAYANQHFAAGIPGWKTDRGRIFIMYGPPDSIDAHPGSVGPAKPYEVWHYRVIQEYKQPEQVQETEDDQALLVTKKDVAMKFVDTCSCGHFQLQTSPKE